MEGSLYQLRSYRSEDQEPWELSLLQGDLGLEIPLPGTRYFSVTPGFALITDLWSAGPGIPVNANSIRMWNYVEGTFALPLQGGGILESSFTWITASNQKASKSLPKLIWEIRMRLPISKSSNQNR